MHLLGAWVDSTVFLDGSNKVVKFYRGISPEIVQKYHSIQGKVSRYVKGNLSEIPIDATLGWNGELLGRVGLSVLDLTTGRIQERNSSLVGEKVGIDINGRDILIPEHTCSVILPFIAGETLESAIQYQLVKRKWVTSVAQVLLDHDIPVTGDGDYQGMSPVNMKVLSYPGGVDIKITDLGGMIESTVITASGSIFS